MKIFFIGFMGSGKTYWGHLLGQKLGMRFFDLDEEIEDAEQKTIPEIFEAQGEEMFRLKEKDILHILTESHDSFVMACGGGTPCYYNNIEYMKQAGTTVWVQASMDILFDRLIKEKEKRPLLSQLDDEQLKNFVVRKYADRKIYYDQAQVIVDTASATTEKLIEQIFHA